jgi:hypothetical protein
VRSSGSAQLLVDSDIYMHAIHRLEEEAADQMAALIFSEPLSGD